MPMFQLYVITRRRAKIKSDKNISVFKLPNITKTLKTTDNSGLTDTNLMKRHFTILSSNDVTL